MASENAADRDPMADVPDFMEPAPTNVGQRRSEFTDPPKRPREAQSSAAWIERGYWRIEGDLWCCPTCHAATPKPDEHDAWHKRLLGSTGVMGSIFTSFGQEPL